MPRIGLPGRRLDRVHGARVEASALATATPPPRPPQPQPVRRAVAGPRFEYVKLYGPRIREHMKVLATIAAFVDAGIRDPSIREINHYVKLPSATDVLAIVRQLEGERWISVDWGPRAPRQTQSDYRNRYAINDRPVALK